MLDQLAQYVNLPITLEEKFKRLKQWTSNLAVPDMTTHVFYLLTVSYTRDCPSLESLPEGLMNVLDFLEALSVYTLQTQPALESFHLVLTFQCLRKMS